MCRGGNCSSTSKYARSASLRSQTPTTPTPPECLRFRFYLVLELHLFTGVSRFRLGLKISRSSGEEVPYPLTFSMNLRTPLFSNKAGAWPVSDACMGAVIVCADHTGWYW